MRILITGGAGFVGANMCLALREAWPQSSIIALDNLKRRGSERNLAVFKKHGIEFMHGDVRNREDVEGIGFVDVLLECSAEPSVLAGQNGGVRYVLDTNLYGVINCLEVCRQYKALCLFMSTSRVYAYEALQNLALCEDDTRFRLKPWQKQHGVSEYGVAEDFSTSGPKSLYGVTKFAAEQLIQEYADAFGLRAVINRCGVIAGPGQFGRSDQGIVPFWIKAHLQEQPLSYIGFGGQGKQVRDILHICDLERLMVEQIRAPEPFLGEIFNVGGGMENAVSLLELTELCRRHTGKQIEISAVPENRYADVPLYVTDNGRISARCGWAPEFGLESIVSDTCQWLKQELV